MKYWEDEVREVYSTQYPSLSFPDSSIRTWEDGNETQDSNLEKRRVGTFRGGNMPRILCHVTGLHDDHHDCLAPTSQYKGALLQATSTTIKISMRCLK